MTTEQFADLAIRHLDGDLTSDERAALQRHLAAHPEDARILDALRAGETALRNRSRPQPPADLLDRYHADLATRFPADLPRPEPTFRQWWMTRPSTVRALSAAAAVVTLLIVGRWFLAPPPATVPIPQTAQMGLYPVESRDVQMIREHWIDTEMILLDILNRDTLDARGLETLRRQSARLLDRGQRVQATAVRTNDALMVMVLSRLEMLLYDVVNMDAGDGPERLADLQMLIEQANLLSDVRYLQTVFQTSESDPPA